MVRKQRSGKLLPNKEKVQQFKEYLLDENLRDIRPKHKHKISFARIFNMQKITAYPLGFTLAEMAAAYNELFSTPDNDDQGYPSYESKRSIKMKIKYENERNNPYLELYATPGINPTTLKREHRYHITQDYDDSKKQTDPMFHIAKCIELNAHKRLKNVQLDPVERMRKVELLDEWFGRGDNGNNSGGSS